MEKTNDLRRRALIQILEGAHPDLRERGWVVVPQAAPDALVQALLQEFDKFRTGGYPDGSFGDFRDENSFPLVLNRVDKVSDLLFDAARGPLLKGLAERLVGGPVVPLHVEYFSKPPASAFVSPPHQDQIFYEDHFIDELAVVLWIALTDIGYDDAPLQYFAQPDLTLLQHRHSENIDFDYELDQLPATEPTTILLKAGDALVHHAFVVHQAAPNRSTTPRIAVGFNYRTSEWQRAYGGRLG